MNKGTVWIVNYYTSTPENASNPRYLQIAHYLQLAGYKVMTFNAAYKEGEQKEKFRRAKYGEYDFVHVKAPTYKGNGLKRMYSIFAFAWRILMNVKKFKKPDVVLHNIHAPFDFPVLWATRRIKAKYVGEVWDLWPFMFVHMGLVSEKNPAMRLFYWVEKQIYYHADQLVFGALGCFDYLKNKGWTTETGGKIDMNKVHYIITGVNLEDFYTDRDAHPRKDEDINRKDIFKIIYMGSVSYVNQVQVLVDAAALMRRDERYRFFIYGDGTYRDDLEKYVNEHNCNNIILKERRIPFNEVAWVVSQATVNVMTYKKGFGCLGMGSGKTLQYLAAAKPILCNVEIRYDDFITENNIGIAHDIETPEELSAAIRQLAEQPKDAYDAMCERCKKVSERFDYKVLAAEEIRVIESALSSI